MLLPEILPKITRVWLDSAVPSSLEEMDRFQQVIAAAKEFHITLKSLGFSNLGDLQEWADSAPRVWLSKRREAALNSMRTKLSEGLGTTKSVERVEKQLVSKSEGKQLAANRAVADDDDHGWDTAWSDGGDGEKDSEIKTTPTAAPAESADEDDGADAWGAWGEDDTGDLEKKEEVVEEEEVNKDDEDDAADAWGVWGDDTNDDGGAGQVEAASKTAQAPKEQKTRELTLKETYNITSMPQPVLDLIFAIVEDGAALTQDRYASSPVAAAAAGLFSLPTLALAMFRAISPYYYAPRDGGNM